MSGISKNLFMIFRDALMLMVVAISLWVKIRIHSGLAKISSVIPAKGGIHSEFDRLSYGFPPSRE
jgi:hypothetical protein